MIFRMSHITTANDCQISRVHAIMSHNYSLHTSSLKSDQELQSFFSMTVILWLLSDVNVNTQPRCKFVMSQVGRRVTEDNKNVNVTEG